jgi:hypothetical protein
VVICGIVQRAGGTVRFFPTDEELRETYGRGYKASAMADYFYHEAIEKARSEVGLDSMFDFGGISL